MKLRMQSNSIRLRLKQGEVQKLVKTGCVEEKIAFGASSKDTFHYVLESSHAAVRPQAIFKNNGILVQVPVETVQNWASGDGVGIEATQSAGAQGKLQILIEKDFACLNNNPEQNFDAFPNPLAGMKC